MLLAGDIGGTKTLLGLFERGRPRPVQHVVHHYPTASFAQFSDILEEFAREVSGPFNVESAAFGVAGPVLGDRATLTNVGMHVSASEIGARFGTSRTVLLNDLEAMASAIAVLGPDELVTLQDGAPVEHGNRAVIAAGTGLGEAYLHAMDDGWRAMPTESGHADFAARTDREMELVRMLRERYGRAEVEYVLSGPGLVNLHRFTHRGGECPVIDDLDAPDAPARVSQAALGGRCQGCADALKMFVSAYGAEAGNLALRSMATGGVYIGGGIARKIMPAMTNGRFMDAFLDKAPLTDLLARMPVNVILNEGAGLLGAAVRAQGL